VNGSWNSSNLLLSVTGLVSFSLSPIPIFLFSDFQDREGRRGGGGHLRVHQHEEVAHVTPVRNRLSHLLFADAVVVR